MNDTFVSLPEGNWCFSRQALGRVLVIAGGRKPQKRWLKKAAAETMVYCADKGLDYAFAADLLPVCVCSDNDSSAPDNQKKVREIKICSYNYPAEKDQTDLQLLLQKIPRQSLVIATGIWGGRFDHLWSNILSLAAVQKTRDLTVIMADHKELMFFLQTGEKAQFSLKKTAKVLSVLPFKQKNIISLEGVKWSLNCAEVTEDNPYTVSNEVIEKTVNIECASGLIGVYLSF